MRRFIFDKYGEFSYYLTGAGVLYDASNNAVAWLQEDGVVSPQGEFIGWFDGAFLRDGEGCLLGFVKGARVPEEAGLELPQTKLLNFKPEPKPAPFYPLLVTRDKPEFTWQWSDKMRLSASQFEVSEVYV